MADLESSKPAPQTARRVPDVFDALHNEMERVFQRFEQTWPRWPGLLRGGAATGAQAALPSLDVHENTDKVTIEADLPGLDEKDVSVTLANGVLTIRGERKTEREEKDDNYYLSERSFGRFERAIRLPESVDENRIEARFDKGVLTVIAAKKPEAVKQEKRIEVTKG